MPDTILPYAKAWAALVVAVLTAVSVVTSLPHWVTIALAGLSVLAVYQAPANRINTSEDPGDGGPVA